MLKNLWHLVATIAAFAFRAPLMLMLGITGAPGAVDPKAICNLFASELILKHYNTSVIAQITNTDADSSGIKSKGAKVTFERLPDTIIRPYTSDQDMIMDRQDSTFVDLIVNRANYFFFGDDIINLKQYTIGDKLDKQVADADKKVKEYVDREFLGSVYADAAASNRGAAAGVQEARYNLGTTGAPVGVSNTSIIKKIAELKGVCDQQSMDQSGRYLVLPSSFDVLLSQSDLEDKQKTGKDSSIFGDYYGSIHDFDIYKSNLYTPVSDTGKVCYPILFGHKSAICYVAQMTKMDYFEKLERTAGQAMRGVMVYDWKTIDPLMLGVWYGYAI
jgi:hypothetical protein